MQLKQSNTKGRFQPVQYLAGLVGSLKDRSLYGPVGLEFGRENIYLVQIKYTVDRDGIKTVQGSRSYSLSYDRNIAFTQSGRLKAWLRLAKSRSGLKGKQVVTCLPYDQLKLVHVSYQLSKGEGESESQIMLKQAMKIIDGDIQNWVVDYIPLRSSQVDNEQKSALVTIAKKEVVQNFLELLRLSGMEVKYLEIGPVAIQRLITAVQQKNDSFENCLVLNFGSHHSYLSVFSGRRLILDREIEFGEIALIDNLSNTLELDYSTAKNILYHYGVMSKSLMSGSDQLTAGQDQISDTVAEIMKPELKRLVAEISKVLVYVASQSHGSRIDIVYLLGGVARWPGIEKILGELLSLPLEILNPLKCFNAEDPDTTQDSEWLADAGFSVATGCALKGVIESDE